MSSSTGQLSGGTGPVRGTGPARGAALTPGKLPRSATSSREDGIDNPSFRTGLSLGSEVGHMMHSRDL